MTQKKLVLFVHGLFGTAEGTWQKFPELVKNDVELATEYAVRLYEYPSTYWCLGRYYIPAICTPTVSTLADALRTQINNRYGTFDSIVLVTHSLGGIVSMKYLLTEIESNRHLRVSRVLLFVAPTSGSDLAALAADLAPWNVALAAELSSKSSYMQALVLSWVKMRVNERIRTKYVLAALDFVIERENLRLIWDDVETVVNKGHVNVVKPQTAQDDSFIILRNFIRAER